MTESAIKRLLGGASACSLLLIAVFLWVNRDSLAASAVTQASFQILLLIALFGLGACAIGYRLLSRSQREAARLERYVAALPSTEATASLVESPEFHSLSRAVKAMAERVRHVMERASAELNRRETILACMAEGVLAVDAQLRVIFCNEAFAEAFRIRTPVTEGRILYEVVREPLLRDILQRVVESNVAETDRFQLPSAAGRWFEARALPFSQQPSRGAVVVLHDITDIERQEQTRKDFVADVSHELRTPLAAIRGYAETLLDGALDDSENNRRFVEIIQAHAIRLNNIASDLLIISELDMNKPPPVPAESIPVLEVMSSAVNTVKQSATLSRISINVEQCAACSVLGYRFRLEQVLVNLLDNAVKFNKQDGTVSVECRAVEPGSVRISISDSGIGIPSEDLKRIFERFYRVDKARSRPAGGTGLGLPIVKELVERMGGSVAVESQLGRGSKFTILLRAAS